MRSKKESLSQRPKLEIFNPRNEFKVGLAALIFAASRQAQLIANYLTQEKPAPRNTLTAEAIRSTLDNTPVHHLNQSEQNLVEHMAGFITEQDLQKIVDYSNTCIEMISTDEEIHRQIIFTGFPIYEVDGSLIRFIPFSVSCGYPKIEVTSSFVGDSRIESNGLVFQLARVVSGSASNTLAIESADVFAPSLTVALPSFGVAPGSGAIKLIPVHRLESSETVFLSDTEFTRTVLQEFTGTSSCGFTSPEIAEQRTGVKNGQFVGTDSMGKDWYVEICQHDVTAASGPTEYRLDALPSEMEALFADDFLRNKSATERQNYPLYPQNGEIEIWVEAQVGAPYGITIYRGSSSNGEPIATSTTIGFTEDLLKVRDTIPEEKSLPFQFSDSAAALVIGGSLIFHALRRGKRKLSPQETKKTTSETRVIEFEADFLDRADQLLISVLELQLLLPDTILGSVELLHQIVRTLQNEDERELFLNQLPSGSRILSPHPDEQLIASELMNYKANAVSSKNSLGNRLIRATLAYLRSSATDTPAEVDFYNDQLRQVHNRYQGAFTDLSPIPPTQLETERAKQIQFYFESGEQVVPVYEVADIADLLPLPVNDLRVRETSLKEIKGFLEVVMADKGDFLGINNYIEQRGRFTKLKTGGDTVLVGYEIQGWGYLVLDVLIDMNGDVNEYYLNAEFHRELPDLMELKKQQEKVAQETIIQSVKPERTVEYTLEQAAEYLEEGMLFLLDSQLLPNDQFEATRQELVDFVETLNEESKVKKEVVRRLAEVIASYIKGRISDPEKNPDVRAIYEENVKIKGESVKFASVMAARLYEYVLKKVRTSEASFEAFTEDSAKILRRKGFTPLVETGRKSWVKRKTLRIQIVQVERSSDEKAIALLFTGDDHT